MTSESTKNTFLNGTTSLLRRIFPDAVRGRRHGTRHECEIEHTPFFVEADAADEWPEIHDVIEKSEKVYFMDERPRLIIFKRIRKEPLAVIRLTDFVNFLNKNLWKTPDEQ